MDPVMTEKLQTILKGKNGEKVLNIIQMAAYFAHEGIRSCVFAFVFPNPSELKDAIQFLQRLTLIELSDDESSFSIPCETRSKLREHLSKAGMEEEVLKRAVDLLNQSKEVEHPHLQSVYISAKIHSSLIEDVCKLPGSIIFGMLRAEKFKEAYEFGTTCIQFLSRNLGEFHRVVTELKTFLTFALLMMMKPKDDAMSLLRDIYEKWYQVSRDECYGALLKMITHAIEYDGCDACSCEARVRRMIFLDKNASDISECWDFEKWVLYCEVLIRLEVTKKSMEILDGVIERGKVLFGKEVSFVTAMHVKAFGLIEVLKLREAMDLLNAILDKRRDKFGPMNVKSLGIQIDIGRILTRNTEYDVSMKLFEEVANSLKQVVGETHDLYLVAEENIVEIYRKKHDMDKAYELSSNLSDRLVSRYGAFHPKTCACRFSLGEILLEMRKFEEARKVFQELLDISEKILVPSIETSLLKLRIFTSEHADCITAPSSLHLATKDGDLTEVLLLIDEGRDIEARDHTGRMPLHYASQYGHIEIARMFIGKGSSFNYQNHNGATPLQLANGDGMKTLLKTFHSFFDAVKADDIDGVSVAALKDSIYLRARDSDHCTCLHWAAALGHTKLVKVLLELGSDPTEITSKRNTPLHLAAFKGRVGVAAALLQALPPDAVRDQLSRKTTNLNTPLHAAARNGFLEVARTLLAHGAVCNAKNGRGKTPFMSSKVGGCRNLLGVVEGLFFDVKNGDVETVRLKLRGLKAEDVLSVTKARNEENRTLFQEARELKHLELAKELLMFMLKDE